MKRNLMAITISFMLVIILAGTVSAENSVDVDVQAYYTNIYDQIITSANPGETIFEVINVESVTENTGGLIIEDIPDANILFTGNVNPEPGTTYDYLVGWQIPNMLNGESFLLKKEFTVPEEVEETIDLIKPEVIVKQAPALILSSSPTTKTLVKSEPTTITEKTHKIVKKSVTTKTKWK